LGSSGIGGGRHLLDFGGAFLGFWRRCGLLGGPLGGRR